MKRRDFIKKAAIGTAGSLVLPHILPTGSLFAQSNTPLAEHVVYVMFAGGVRQDESVLQRYLDGSQGVNIPGNIMQNLLLGDLPQSKVVFGTNPGGGGIPGSVPIPKILNQTLQEQGALFREVRAGSSGHYSGLNTLLTGSIADTQGLRQKPLFPTIFEYARKYLGLKATDTWFVGNGIANSLPLLNYSIHPDFGASFGANFLAPNITFGGDGVKHLSNARIYHPEEELDPMRQMKFLLDNNFRSNGGLSIPDIGNTDEEKENIKSFIREIFIKKASNTIAHSPVNDSSDLNNIGYACEVLKWFKPKLLVVNLSNVDTCHSDFTSYLQSLHRADHGVGHLWDFIQTQIPEMAGKTTMIISPEHGRNLNSNSILDSNGWQAYDHSDQHSRRMFTMMVGKAVPQNMQIGNENNPIGIAQDNILTIAEILGFKQDVINEGLVTRNAASLFDRI